MTSCKVTSCETIAQPKDRARPSDCSPGRFTKRAVIVTFHAALTFALFFAMLAAVGTTAQAQTETVLYSFCSMANCADGFGPLGSLAIDADGNLFGATYSGGSHCCGTVFDLSPAGTLNVRKSFSDSFGAYPRGSMIWDAKGNLFGTTGGSTFELGLSNGFYGSVFELKKQSFKFRYRFIGNEANGAEPPAGAALTLDAQGNLYGTTQAGGNAGCFDFGCGTVFRLAPDGTETVLHNFSEGADGGDVFSSVILDAAGNLYGTTFLGGIADAPCNSRCGTVFKITPDGAETVLYAFQGGTDAANPTAGLVMDGQGNLYGTTQSGGQGGGDGNGTVFKLTPNGSETVLYRFTGGTDGLWPDTPLVLDAQGNLYGTTQAGGGSGCRESAGCGIVFKVTPSGKETILHRFSGGTDGGEPQGGLVLDANGNLYGTTYGGGTGTCYDNVPGCGVIFKITP